MKYTVTFKVTTAGASNNSDLALSDFYDSLQDLLKKAVLPALDAELMPLTFEVKKARK